MHTGWLVLISLGLPAPPVLCERLCQDGIVKMHVHHKVPLQVFLLFRGAPGPAEQPVDIGPQHGKGVVDGKKRINSIRTKPNNQQR